MAIMTSIIRNLDRNPIIKSYLLTNQHARILSTSADSMAPFKDEDRLPMTEKERRIYPQVKQNTDSEGYPILKLFPKERTAFDKFTPKSLKTRPNKPDHKPREMDMDPEQDWPSVWPTSKTFVPSAVPLPLRQSYQKRGVPRGKYSNTELIKIRNFLHLTPTAIERQCNAIKKFCTKWPEGLETDEDVEFHFPVTRITHDYVHSAPTIRDERARVVITNFNISALNLDAKSKDKMIRLLGPRYDKKTGMITIRTDACPVRIQNEDYADYLLTALYYESMNHESWEEDKPECDWEKFFWTKSESKQKAKLYRSLTNPDITDETIEKGEGDPVIEEYKQSLEKIYINENVANLESYRLSVEKMLGLDRPVLSAQT